MGKWDPVGGALLAESGREGDRLDEFGTGERQIASESTKMPATRPEFSVDIT